MLMMQDLKKANDHYFFSSLKKTIQDAQEIYTLVLKKLPKREYVHIEDPDEDSVILETEPNESGDPINMDHIDVNINEK